MTRPIIPLDICFEVIDAAAADISSNSVLQACALTCSAWLGRARFHLYGDVSLTSEEDDESIYTFSRTIAESPKLGALVKSLEIILADHSYWPDEWEDETRGPFNTRAMHNLINLRCLSLIDAEIATDVKFISALADRVTRAPSVEVFKMYEYDLPSVREIVGILDRFPRLSQLEILQAKWTDDTIPSVDQISPHFCNQLTRVVLRENVLFFPLLQILPPTVKVLELGPLLVRNTGLTIDELPEDHFEAISRLIGVDILKLTSVIVNKEDIDWLLDVLTHARNLRVRELFLRYQCGLRESFSTLLGYTRWNEVDDILSEGPFPNLERVSVKMCYPTESDPGAAERCSMMKQQIVASFKGCVRRGIAVVHPDTLHEVVGGVPPPKEPLE